MLDIGSNFFPDLMNASNEIIKPLAAGRRDGWIPIQPSLGKSRIAGYDLFPAESFPFTKGELPQCDAEL